MKIIIPTKSIFKSKNTSMSESVFAQIQFGSELSATTYARNIDKTFSLLIRYYLDFILPLLESAKSGTDIIPLNESEPNQLLKLPQLVKKLEALEKYFNSKSPGGESVVENCYNENKFTTIPIELIFSRSKTTTLIICEFIRDDNFLTLNVLNADAGAEAYHAATTEITTPENRQSICKTYRIDIPDSELAQKKLNEHIIEFFKTLCAANGKHIDDFYRKILPDFYRLSESTKEEKIFKYKKPQRNFNYYSKLIHYFIEAKLTPATFCLFKLNLRLQALFDFSQHFESVHVTGDQHRLISAAIANIHRLASKINQQFPDDLSHDDLTKIIEFVKLKENTIMLKPVQAFCTKNITSEALIKELTLIKSPAIKSKKAYSKTPPYNSFKLIDTTIPDETLFTSRGVIGALLWLKDLLTTNDSKERRESFKATQVEMFFQKLHINNDIIWIELASHHFTEINKVFSYLKDILEVYSSLFLQGSDLFFAQRLITYYKILAVIDKTSCIYFKAMFTPLYPDANELSNVLATLKGCLYLTSNSRSRITELLQNLSIITVNPLFDKMRLETYEYFQQRIEEIGYTEDNCFLSNPKFTGKPLQVRAYLSQIFAHPREKQDAIIARAERILTLTKNNLTTRYDFQTLDQLPSRHEKLIFSLIYADAPSEEFKELQSQITWFKSILAIDFYINQITTSDFWHTNRSLFDRHACVREIPNILRTEQSIKLGISVYKLRHYDEFFKKSDYSVHVYVGDKENNSNNHYDFVKNPLYFANTSLYQAVNGSRTESANVLIAKFLECYNPKLLETLKKELSQIAHDHNFTPVNVLDFFSRNHKLLIDGKFIPGSKKLEESIALAKDCQQLFLSLMYASDLQLETQLKRTPEFFDDLVAWLFKSLGFAKNIETKKLEKKTVEISSHMVFYVKVYAWFRHYLMHTTLSLSSKQQEKLKKLECAINHFVVVDSPNDNCTETLPTAGRVLKEEQSCLETLKVLINAISILSDGMQLKATNLSSFMYGVAFRYYYRPPKEYVYTSTFSVGSSAYLERSRYLDKTLHDAFNFDWDPISEKLASDLTLQVYNFIEKSFNKPTKDSKKILNILQEAFRQLARQFKFIDKLEDPIVLITKFPQIKALKKRNFNEQEYITFNFSTGKVNYGDSTEYKQLPQEFYNNKEIQRYFKGTLPSNLWGMVKSSDTDFIYTFTLYEDCRNKQTVEYELICTQNSSSLYQTFKIGRGSLPQKFILVNNNELNSYFDSSKVIRHQDPEFIWFSVTDAKQPARILLEPAEKNMLVIESKNFVRELVTDTREYTGYRLGKPSKTALLWDKCFLKIEEEQRIRIFCNVNSNSESPVLRIEIPRLRLDFYTQEHKIYCKQKPNFYLRDTSLLTGQYPFICHFNDLIFLENDKSDVIAIVPVRPLEFYAAIGGQNRYKLNYYDTLRFHNTNKTAYYTYIVKENKLEPKSAEACLYLVYLCLNNAEYEKAWDYLVQVRLTFPIVGKANEFSLLRAIVNSTRASEYDPSRLNKQSQFLAIVANAAALLAELAQNTPKLSIGQIEPNDTLKSSLVSLRQYCKKELYEDLTAIVIDVVGNKNIPKTMRLSDKDMFWLLTATARKPQPVAVTQEYARLRQLFNAKFESQQKLSPHFVNFLSYHYAVESRCLDVARRLSPEDIISFFKKNTELTDLFNRQRNETPSISELTELTKKLADFTSFFNKNPVLDNLNLYHLNNEKIENFIRKNFFLIYHWILQASTSQKNREKLAEHLIALIRQATLVFPGTLGDAEIYKHKLLEKGIILLNSILQAPHHFNGIDKYVFSIAQHAKQIDKKKDSEIYADVEKKYGSWAEICKDFLRNEGVQTIFSSCPFFKADFSDVFVNFNKAIEYCTDQIETHYHSIKEKNRIKREGREERRKYLSSTFSFVSYRSDRYQYQSETMPPSDESVQLICEKLVNDAKDMLGKRLLNEYDYYHKQYFFSNLFIEVLTAQYQHVNGLTEPAAYANEFRLIIDGADCSESSWCLKVLESSVHLCKGDYCKVYPLTEEDKATFTNTALNSQSKLKYFFKKHDITINSPSDINLLIKAEIPSFVNNLQIQPQLTKVISLSYTGKLDSHEIAEQMMTQEPKIKTLLDELSHHRQPEVKEDLFNAACANDRYRQQELEELNANYQEGARLNLLDIAHKKIADKHLNDVATLSSVAEHATLLKKKIQGTVEKYWCEIDNLANHTYQSDEHKILVEVARGGKQLTILTKPQLIYLFLKGEENLYRQETILENSADIQRLDNLLREYVYYVNQVQHLELIEEACEKSLKVCSDGDQQPSYEFYKLAHLLNLQRAYDWRTTRVYAVLEYYEKIVIRQEQYELVTRLLARDNQGKPINRVAQLIMGGGKTKVGAPILLQEFADGSNLVIFDVPKELLETNFQDIFETFMRLFGKKCHKFSFSRHHPYEITEIDGDILQVNQLTSDDLYNIYHSLLRWVEAREILVASGDSIQSLLAKHTEYLVLRSKCFNKEEEKELDNKIKYMELIDDLLKHHTDILCDEVHKRLDRSRALIYSAGIQRPITSIYKDLPKQGVDFFRGLMKLPLVSTINKEEKTFTLLQLIRHEVVLPKTQPEWDSVILSLVDHLVDPSPETLEDTLYNKAPLLKLVKMIDDVRNKEEKDNFRKTLKKYLYLPQDDGERDSSFKQEEEKLINFINDENIQNQIALYKHFLNDLLKILLPKDFNFHYGYSKNQKEIERKYIAIPMEGVDKPREGAKYDEYQTLFMSVQGLLQVNQAIPYELFKNRMVALYETANKEFKKAQLDNINKTPTATFIRLMLEKDENFDVRVFCYNETISEEYERVYQKSWQIYRHNDNLKLFVLEKDIIPQIDYDEFAITVNPFNYVNNVHSFRGFTGTPVFKDSYHWSVEYDPRVSFGTDGRTLHRLVSKNTQVIQMPEYTEPLALLNFYYEKLDTKKKLQLRGLIDNGLFKDHNNVVIAEQIAKFLSSKNSPIEWVIFFDNDELSAMSVKDHEVIRIGKSSPNNIAAHIGHDFSTHSFTFWDQNHTVGADILQAPDSIALQTFSLLSSLYEVLQATMRLRGFPYLQEVIFALAGPLAMSFENKESSLKAVLEYFFDRYFEPSLTHNYLAVQEQIHSLLEWDLKQRVKHEKNIDKKMHMFRQCIKHDFFVVKQGLSPYQKFGTSESWENTQAVLTQMECDVVTRWRSVLAAINISLATNEEDDIKAIRKSILQRAQKTTADKVKTSLSRHTVGMELELQRELELQKVQEIEQEVEKEEEWLANRHYITLLPENPPTLSLTQSELTSIKFIKGEALPSKTSPIVLYGLNEIKTLLYPTLDIVFDTTILVSENAFRTGKASSFTRQEQLQGMFSPFQKSRIYLLFVYHKQEQRFTAAILSGDDAMTFYQLTDNQRFKDMTSYSFWLFNAGQRLLAEYVREGDSSILSSYKVLIRRVREQFYFVSNQFDLLDKLIKREDQVITGGHWLREQATPKAKYLAAFPLVTKLADSRALISLKDKLSSLGNELPKPELLSPQIFIDESLLLENHLQELYCSFRESTHYIDSSLSIFICKKSGEESLQLNTLQQQFITYEDNLFDIINTKRDKAHSCFVLVPDPAVITELYQQPNAERLIALHMENTDKTLANLLLLGIFSFYTQDDSYQKSTSFWYFKRWSSRLRAHYRDLEPGQLPDMVSFLTGLDEEVLYPGLDQEYNRGREQADKTKSRIFTKHSNRALQIHFLNVITNKLRSTPILDEQSYAVADYQYKQNVLLGAYLLVINEIDSEKTYLFSRPSVLRELCVEKFASLATNFAHEVSDINDLSNRAYRKYTRNTQQFCDFSKDTTLQAFIKRAPLVYKAQVSKTFEQAKYYLEKSKLLKFRQLVENDHHLLYSVDSNHKNLLYYALFYNNPDAVKYLLFNGVQWQPDNLVSEHLANQSLADRIFSHYANDDAQEQYSKNVKALLDTALPLNKVNCFIANDHACKSLIEDEVTARSSRTKRLLVVGFLASLAVGGGVFTAVMLTGMVKILPAILFGIALTATVKVALLACCAALCAVAVVGGIIGIGLGIAHFLKVKRLQHARQSQKIEIDKNERERLGNKILTSVETRVHRDCAEQAKRKCAALEAQSYNLPLLRCFKQQLKRVNFNCRQKQKDVLQDIDSAYAAAEKRVSY